MNARRAPRRTDAVARAGVPKAAPGTNRLEERLGRRERRERER